MFRPFKKKFQNENCDKLVNITVKFNFVEFMVGAWKTLVLFAVAHVQSSAMAVKVRSLTRGSFFAFHAATSSGLSSNCLSDTLQSVSLHVYVQQSAETGCNIAIEKNSKVETTYKYTHIISSCSSCSWQVEMTQRKYFQKVSVAVHSTNLWTV